MGHRPGGLGPCDHAGRRQLRRDIGAAGSLEGQDGQLDARAQRFGPFEGHERLAHIRAVHVRGDEKDLHGRASCGSAVGQALGRSATTARKCRALARAPGRPKSETADHSTARDALWAARIVKTGNRGGEPPVLAVEPRGPLRHQHVAAVVELACRAFCRNG